MSSKKPSVLGIGNALMDILTLLPNDDYLQQYELPKGSMQLVDFDKVKLIESGTKDLEKELAAGGSAANTIHGLANLGINTAFIGTICDDETGNQFLMDMKKSGIDPKLYFGEQPSGRAMAMISPDSERTFATFLGAAIELSADHLSIDRFQGFDVLHIEGYLVQNHDLIQKAIDLAKEAGMMISIDMASFNVVEANLEFLKDLVEQGVDILFANEEEAKSFTGKEPVEALHHIAEKVPTAIVKIGAKGSMIKNGGHVYHVEPFDANPVDTTGAGDLYASGFLYGFLNELPLQTCGKIGSLLSARVIEKIGAKLNADEYQIIQDQITSF